MKGLYSGENFCTPYELCQDEKQKLITLGYLDALLWHANGQQPTTVAANKQKEVSEGSLLGLNPHKKGTLSMHLPPDNYASREIFYLMQLDL